MRKIWLKQLNRENYLPSESTVFCQRHFEDDAFVSDELNLTTRGKLKRKKSLKKHAYPTLFLGPGQGIAIACCICSLLISQCSNILKKNRKIAKAFTVDFQP